MDNITKISKIDKHKLVLNNYLKSLLEQALEQKLISDIELEKVQIDCLSILALQTERYNKSDSSSIRIEMAQSLLNSIMFVISVYLKTFPCPDDAVAAIKNEHMDVLFKRGNECVYKLIKRTKLLHCTVLSKLVDTQNIFYRSTIRDGIKGFFKLYNPDFTAQEIHITADYPSYNNMEDLDGIEFISAYLENIYYENLFCHNFNPEDIHALLYGYNSDYENLILNIYEPILASALGCVLAKADVRRLRLGKESISILEKIFVDKSESEIIFILNKALDELSNFIKISDSLKEYIKKSVIKLANEISIAVNLSTLNKVFIIPKYEENVPIICTSFDDKMNDTLYRRVLDDFMQSHCAEEKLKIIREQIRSLGDLNDLLLDSELQEDELRELLALLSAPEIAALVHKYKLQYEMGFTELRDSEKVLGKSLHDFMETLTSAQKAWIDKMISYL